MERILYASSELFLLGGILWLLIKHLWGGQNLKDYFKTAKIVLVASFICRLIFYNKAVVEGYAVSTPYTVAFYGFVVLTAYFWLSLSYRWFLSNDVPPLRFCVLALWSVLASAVILSAVNAAVLFFGLFLLGLTNYRFVCFSQDTEEFHPISRRYGTMMMLFGVWFLTVLVLIEPQNWSYEYLKGYLAYTDKWITLFIIGGLLFWILALIAAAPLHFLLPEIVAPSVLPVAAYFILIPFFALWAAFIHLNVSVFEAYREPLKDFYLIVGTLSVFIGALGVHAGRQIKKMLAYIAVYNTGVFLIVLAPFSEEALEAALIGMQSYMLAVLGICVCLYAFKYHREYLNNIAMLHGMASVRPYVASVFLAMLLSLMQWPPFAGFVGLFSALYGLMLQKAYIFVGVIVLGLIVLSSAFIRLIQAVFFMPRTTDYDRSDTGVCLYLFPIVILAVAVLFCPEILREQAQIILSGLENM
jgi:NADH-quinone oxidoreductase subunit N